MSSTATETLLEAQDQPVQHLLQLATGFMHTAALFTVAKLDIAGLLANGPRPVSELAEATRSDQDALYRVLRMLASAGVFTETAPRKFALSPAAEPLRSDAPGSMRNVVIWMCNRFHFHVWAELPYSVATGKPAMEHVYGKPGFDALVEMPETFREFNQAMSEFSAVLAPAVLEVYNFSGIGTLMDVAGGHGATLCEILNRYPAMKGVLFDLESVVEGARERLHAVMNGRCRIAAGDFFKHIPAGADAIYMQHIIHDWDDEPALKILENCRRALDGAKNARLLVVDSVIPEGPEPHFAKMLDIEMLLMPGGRERTEREWRDLFARAGFEITRIVPTRAAESVIEARPV
jgi:hypothetical protein